MATQKDVFSGLDASDYDPQSQPQNDELTVIPQWKWRMDRCDAFIDALEQNNIKAGGDPLPHINEKTLTIYSLLIKWLKEEKHANLRLKIVRHLMPVFVDSIPAHQLPQTSELAGLLIGTLLSSINQQHYPFLKDLVTKLWLKTNFSLIEPNVVDGLVKMMKQCHSVSYVKDRQLFAYEFLIMCTFYPSRKMNLIDFVVSKPHNIPQIIMRSMRSARQYQVKRCAAQLFHGMISTLKFQRFGFQSIPDAVDAVNDEYLLNTAKQQYERKRRKFQSEHEFPDLQQIQANNNNDNDNDDGKEDQKIPEHASDENKDDEKSTVRPLLPSESQQSQHSDEECRRKAIEVFTEPQSRTQLHVWDSRSAAWVPLQQALETQSQKQIVTKSAMMMSKKFGGLDPAEILMYEAVEKGCRDLYEVTMPHDLLMMILVYSQGYKFDTGDQCMMFPSGIFSDSSRGVIKDVLENASQKNSYLYLVKRLHGGGKVRVPFNHVFGEKIVIVDESAFKQQYAQLPAAKELKYGDVLDVNRLRVVEEQVYSKKKKRNVRKMKVVMRCTQLKDLRAPRYYGDNRRRTYEWRVFDDDDDDDQMQAPRRGADVDVTWDHTVFVQAKWKKVDS